MILFLGNDTNPIVNFLHREKEFVVCMTDKLSLDTIKAFKPDHIISYGYRHIIQPDVILEYPRIINLHISYLPFNRGSDPNLWSWIDGSEKGVSIHYIDRGIDTGNLLLQQKVSINDNETLKSSYDILQNTIQNLFIKNWDKLKEYSIEAKPQRGLGSFHKMADRPAGINWNMQVSELAKFKKR